MSHLTNQMTFPNNTAMVNYNTILRHGICLILTSKYLFTGSTIGAMTQLHDPCCEQPTG